MIRATRCAALSFAVLIFAAIGVPATTHAAMLYLDTEATTYGLGDTFIATVRLDNEESCINAAHVEITYPTDMLRAVDFSRGGSMFTLWVEEPRIDTAAGTILFSGGIPGGYCGRIPGDPVLSNVVGKVVFTVIGAASDTAAIEFSPQSVVYENDGLGTEAEVTRHALQMDIQPTSTQADNPWLAEVQADTIPPDPFTIHVESTRGVFGGRYYIVFSTVDKQSGLDHYELFERGAWRHITSPYQLKDQFLPDAIQVRAIDKAGNERFGDYNKADAPPRQFSVRDAIPLLIIVGVFGLFVLLGLIKMHTARRSRARSQSRTSTVYDDTANE